MKKIIPSLVYLLCFINTLFSESLFNGMDLSGWTMDVPAHDKKPDAPKPFIVRDGMLVSLGKPAGHLLTDKQYSNYRLEVEYRFAGKPDRKSVV